MALDTEVGLGQRQILLDWDYLPSLKRGQSPGDCVRWGPSSPPLKGRSPQFSANVHCGQTAGWIEMLLGMEVGLGPGNFVLDGVPATRKKSTPTPTPFWPMSIVAKRLDGSRCHLVRR